jgi:hypothetical protein
VGREAIAGAYHAARLPFLRRRLNTLTGRPTSAPSAMFGPVLSQQAAAEPSEQPR